MHRAGCDFYIGSGHKWLLAVSGIPFVYVRAETLAAGEFAPFPRERYGPWPPSDAAAAPPTARWQAECGTTGPEPLAGLEAALDLWSAIGVGQCREHVRRLATKLKAAAAGIPGVHCITPAVAGTSGLVTLGFDSGRITPAQLQQVTYRLYAKHAVNAKFQWCAAGTHACCLPCQACNDHTPLRAVCRPGVVAAAG